MEQVCAAGWLLCAAASAPAQTNPWEIPKPDTYRGSVELQRRQQQQQPNPPPAAAPSTTRATPPAEQAAATQAASKADYETWDRRPALPAERNPLLGRWSWQPVGAGGMGMQALLDGSTYNAMACSMLFGDGAVEFRADAIVNVQQGRETPGSRVSYRGGGKQVIALQRDGMRAFMAFDFLAPDRVNLSAVGCVMNRVGAATATTAATRAANAAAPPVGTGFEVFGVTLGRSSPDEVRRSVAARGARPLIGRAPGSQELRIEVNDRKYGHPQLANVWYDFRHGVLSSVTLIWERDGTLFRQRADFLARALGLGPPQQPSLLSGTARGTEVVLRDDAVAGLVSESYSTMR